MPIKIAIELEQEAWARCIFRPARKNYTFFIDYDSDGMDKLIMSALILLTDFRSFSFTFHGGQNQWLMSAEQVEDSDDMSFEFSEFYLDLSSNAFATKSVVKFHCDPIVFAKAIFSAITTAVEKSGVRTYNAIWTDYPFPKPLYQYLANRIRDYANDA